MRPEVRSKFDLTIYAVPPQITGAGLRLDLVYNADLFDGGRVSEMAAQPRRAPRPGPWRTPSGGLAIFRW